MIVFLDFDGVLHPLWAPAPFKDWTLERIHGPKPYGGPFFIHAPVLLEVLRPHLAEVDIVISSTWGRKRDLDTLRSLLPSEVAVRVVDAVHHHLPALEDLPRDQGLKSRWAEIAFYREHVRPSIGDRWVAIDDDDFGWPHDQRRHLAHCMRDLGNPDSQAAVESALLICRALHPFADDVGAMRACGEQSGAVGLNEAGDMVERGEGGQPRH